MPNELRDTIEMMNSGDYKERFKAEYYQIVIRYQKLNLCLISGIMISLNLHLLVHEAHIICRLQL